MTDLEKRITVIEDKQAIKDLAGSYLSAADNKNHVEMSKHFTENGKIISIMPETTITLETQQGIADGFAKILSTITNGFHMAGQHLINLDGDKATGTTYSYVILEMKENEKHYVRKISAINKDEYIKENGKWLIQERIATVAWEEFQNLD